MIVPDCAGVEGDDAPRLRCGFMRTRPGSTPLPKSTDWMLSAVAATLCAFLAAAAKIAAVFSKSIHGRLVVVNRPKKLLQLGRLRLQRCELAHEFVHRPSLPFSDVLILAPSNGRA